MPRFSGRPVSAGQGAFDLSGAGQHPDSMPRPRFGGLRSGGLSSFPSTDELLQQEVSRPLPTVVGRAPTPPVAAPPSVSIGDELGFDPFPAPTPPQPEAGTPIATRVPARETAPAPDVVREMEALRRVRGTPDEPAMRQHLAQKYGGFPEFVRQHRVAQRQAQGIPIAGQDVMAPVDPAAVGQNVVELGKGIPAGAVGMAGTAVVGAAGLLQAGGEQLRQRQLAAIAAIDAGQDVPDPDDPIGYKYMSPEQRAAVKADLARPAPAIADSPLYQAGQAVQRFGRDLLPASPGYEDSIGRQLGEGLGSMGAGVAAGLAAGPAGAGALFSLGGIGEAVDRAVQSGATREQILEAGRRGIIPGLTDTVPVEVLLRGGVPLPYVGPVLRAVGQIGAQAVIEGIQEGGQEFLQNLIARDVYKPDQALLEGVPGSAALGGGVGAIAEAVRQLVTMGLTHGRRRGAMPVPAPAGTDTAPEAPVSVRPEAETMVTPEPAAPAPAPDAPPVPEPPTRADLEALIDDNRPLDQIREEEERRAEAEARRLRQESEQRAAAQAAEAGLPPVKSAARLIWSDGESEPSVTVQEYYLLDDGTTGVRIYDEATRSVIYDGPVADIQLLPAQEGDGTRDAPIQVQTSADLDAAGAQTAAPTPAQADAGNYKKGHVRFHGLDIAIETPKGGTRSGVGADGRPWSVRMPAHYGYVKTSKGADGDQVDIYLGDSPESTQVFVVDQIDPDTGKFDEHKAFLGVTGPDIAVTLYNFAFSDGSGLRRMGAITPMSVDEFRQWLAKGDTRKPLTYREPAPPKQEPRTLTVEVQHGGGSIVFPDQLHADLFDYYLALRRSRDAGSQEGLGARAKALFDRLRPWVRDDFKNIGDVNELALDYGDDLTRAGATFSAAMRPGERRSAYLVVDPDLEADYLRRQLEGVLGQTGPEPQTGAVRPRPAGVRRPVDAPAGGRVPAPDRGGDGGRADTGGSGPGVTPATPPVAEQPKKPRFSGRLATEAGKKPKKQKDWPVEEDVRYLARAVVNPKGDRPDGDGPGPGGGPKAQRRDKRSKPVYRTPKFFRELKEINAALRAELDRLGLDDVELIRGMPLTGVMSEGSYYAATIHIANTALDPHLTLRHEAIHALREFRLFTDAEWAALEAAAEKMWLEQFNIDARYPNLDRTGRLEEAIAEGFAHWQRGELTIGGRILRAFNKLKKYLQALANALMGRGFHRADDIMERAEEVLERVESGKVGHRSRDAMWAYLREQLGDDVVDAALKEAAADLARVRGRVGSGGEPKYQVRDPADRTPEGGITIVERDDVGDLNPVKRFLYTPAAAFKRWPELRSLQQFGVRTEVNLSRFNTRLQGEFDHIKARLGGGKQGDERFQKLSDVLFLGDAEERVFTTAELQDELGISDELVIAAYHDMRKLVERLGRFVDQHRRAMQPTLRARKAAVLKRMATLRRMDDPEFRKLYTRRQRLRQKLRSGNGNPEKIAAQIDEIEQRLDIVRQGTGEYQELAQELDRIDAALAQTSVRRRKGYVPHKFFGTWAVYRVTEDADGEPVMSLVAGDNGFFPSRDAAVKGAGAYLDENPGAELVVRPVQFSFPASDATALTDAAYWRFMARVGEAMEIKGDELHDMIRGVARRRFRRRIASFAQFRSGVEGYSRDLDAVMRTHIGEVVRYVMLDKLKYRAINTMERMGLSPHRSYNPKTETLQRAVDAWLRDVNGQKQPVERAIDELLDKPWATPLRSGLAVGTVAFSTFGLAGSPGIGALLGTYLGARTYFALRDAGDFKTRAVTGAMLTDMAHLKLGAFFNLFSAVVNMTQTAVNTTPVLGRYALTGMRLLESAWVSAKIKKEPNRYWRLIERADIATKFKYSEVNTHQFSRIKRVERASLFLFDTAEQFNRAVSFLGAYQRAIDRGASEGQAFREGEAAMVRTQHHYGAANKPEVLRGVLTRIPGQFKNFMFQQIAFIAGLDRRSELPAFLLALFLVAGGIGLPGIDLIDMLIDALTDWSPIAELKKAALDLQAKGEAIGVVANVLLRGLPTLIGEDMSARAGAGDKFLPLELRDYQGPWVSTISQARALAEMNATIGDHIRNLSSGAGRPLKSIEAMANGLPLQDAILNPGAFYQALTDDRIVYTNPWKDGALEYDERTLSRTDLARMAVGSTPLKVAQQRDVTEQSLRLEERHAKKTDGVLRSVVDAYRRYYRPNDRRKLRAAIQTVAERASAEGITLTKQQLDNAIEKAVTPRILRQVKNARRAVRPELFGLMQSAAPELLTPRARASDGGRGAAANP